MNILANMKKWIAYLIILVSVVACSSLQHIEKRRYRKGYFVQWNKKIDKKQPVLANSDFNAESNQVFQNKEVNPLNIQESYFDSTSIALDKSIIIEGENSSNKRVRTKQIKDSPKKSTFEKSSFEGDTSSVKTSNRNFLLLVIAALFGGVSLVLFRFNKNGAKKMAQWAHKNPKASISMITLSKFTMAYFAIHAGVVLGTMGLTFSMGSVYVIVALLSIAAILYPIRGKYRGLFKQGFIRQKIHDISLAVLSFSLLLGVGNLTTHAPERVPITTSFVEATADYSMMNNSPISDENDGGEVAGKVVLTLLVIALFIGLLYLTAILSCNLSCSGQDGLAALVLLVGIIGGITLLVIALKAIWGKK